MIEHPQVFLISKPSFDVSAFQRMMKAMGYEEGDYRFLASWPNEDAYNIVEAACRLCYMSYGKGRKGFGDFSKNILEQKHGSVLEHVVYGFGIIGVSRSLTHELVRHRAGFAYSQLSQRYVDSSDVQFVMPPEMKEMPPQLRESFEHFLTGIGKSYEDLTQALERELNPDGEKMTTDLRKRVRQTARAILPNATETHIFATANVRAWRHFLELRCSPHADSEIRQLGLAILRQLQLEAPFFFGDFEVKKDADGVRTATPIYSKV